MPTPGAGTMGPPSRPVVEKATDTAALTDVIAQSGIDIKDEEKYLTSYFSLDQESSQAQASNYYGELKQYAHNNQNSSYGVGSINQPPGPRKSVEEIAQQQWRAVVRNRAESRCFHLNDPFLAGNSLRQRIDKAAVEAGKDTFQDLPRNVSKDSPVYLPQDGLSVEQLPAPPQPKVNTLSVTGPDGVSLTAVNGYFVEKNAPISEVLTLLSLAARERISALVEEAAVVAKRRQTGSHGVVPAEWKDIAIGNHSETAVPTPSTAGPRDPDSAISPSTVNPRKRSFSNANNLPTPISNGAQTPASTVTFPNELAKHLRGQASRELEVEEGRLNKRTRKSSNALITGNGGKGSTPSTPASASGGGLLGERAPEAPEPKKLTKKEQAKLQSARLDEAHQHRSANSTANRFMSGGASRFGKQKTYSWLNAGGSGTSTPTRPSLGGGLPGGGNIDSRPATPDLIGLTGNEGQNLGGWREDGQKGAGIHLRDWVRTLEMEQRSKMSILRGYAKLK
ncbi:MAG: hypothetical protein M1816_002242 [Peltula sp. TS41687]|nr:MAG: hypothetical protein M1816_002242 [Peltula sp. TS41687]